MERLSLAAQRERRLAAEEKKAGVREQHYLLDGNFVEVFVSFYPRVQWFIADAMRPRGERIRNTTRPLTDDVKARLENWL